MSRTTNVQKLACSSLAVLFVLFLTLITISDASPVARLLSTKNNLQALRARPLHRIVPRMALFDELAADEDEEAEPSNTDQLEPQQFERGFDRILKRSNTLSSPAAKRALSLFAHWRTPYASSEDAGDVPMAATRGEGARPPIGRPLRWG